MIPATRLTLQPRDRFLRQRLTSGRYERSVVWITFLNLCLADGVGTRQRYHRDADPSDGEWGVSLPSILARGGQWTLPQLWGSFGLWAYLVRWLSSQKLLLEEPEDKRDSNSDSVPLLVVAGERSAAERKINSRIPKVSPTLLPFESESKRFVG